MMMNSRAAFACSPSTLNFERASVSRTLAERGGRRPILHASTRARGCTPRTVNRLRSTRGAWSLFAWTMSAARMSPRLGPNDRLNEAERSGPLQKAVERGASNSTDSTKRAGAPCICSPARRLRTSSGIATITWSVTPLARPRASPSRRDNLRSRYPARKIFPPRELHRVVWSLPERSRVASVITGPTVW